MKLPWLAAGACAGIFFSADVSAQRRPQLEHLTYSVERFESEALGGRKVQYGIFLPKDYADAKNKDKRYPLVIWLHGMFEDHDRFYQRGGAPILDRMTGAGDVPALIFVCANGGSSSFYVNGVGDGSAYEDMVREDLVEHLEKTYRISDQRSLRAISGVSMGGYGALKIAFKDPEAFGVVAAHSAALLAKDPDDLAKEFPWLRGRGGQLLAALFGDPVDKQKWAAENVLVLAEHLEPKALDGLKIYFDCGGRDRYEFDTSNLKLHELLTERKIPHVWRLDEQGNHGWRSGYNQSAVPYSLRFIAEQFAAARGRQGLKGLLGPSKDGHKPR